MKRSIVVVLFAVSMGVTAVRAQEKAAVEPAAQPAAPAVKPAAPAGEDLRQQLTELNKQVNALEREAGKNDPTLSAKLDDLEKQRRQTLIQAKPELEALYAQRDVILEKAKALGGKSAAQGGKGRQGGGEAKAEKKAERATQKAEKAAKAAEQK